jgi:hypothetical protein
MVNMFQIFKGVSKQPSRFFASVAKEQGYLKPWLYYIVLMGLFYILSFVVGLPQAVIDSLQDPEIIGGVGVALVIVVAALFLVLLIALMAGLVFVSAGILHLFLMIVGARGYQQTFKMVCYSATPLIYLSPFLLFNILPGGDILYLVCSLAASIWVIVLEVKAAIILHKLSVARAVVGVVVIPLAVAFVLILFFVLLIVGLAAVYSDSLTGMVVNSVL